MDSFSTSISTLVTSNPKDKSITKNRSDVNKTRRSVKDTKPPSYITNNKRNLRIMTVNCKASKMKPLNLKQQYNTKPEIIN